MANLFPAAFMVESWGSSRKGGGIMTLHTQCLKTRFFGGGGRITVQYCVRSQCPIWSLFSCKKKLEDGISEFAVAVLEG